MTTFGSGHFDKMPIKLRIFESGLLNKIQIKRTTLGSGLYYEYQYD